MEFTKYGFKIKDEKHQKVYCMTMADMKITLMQRIVKKGITNLKIRIVDVKAGEVDEYQDMRDFLMTDFNNAWEIELLDVHIVHMNTNNEDIIIVCLRDDESGWL